MAELIEANEIMFTAFEPKLKNRNFSKNRLFGQKNRIFEKCVLGVSRGFYTF